MDVSQRYKKVKILLEKHHQQHLLSFWGELDASGKQQLLEQIEGLDFQAIDGWVAELVRCTEPGRISAQISPVDAYPAKPTSPQQQAEYAQARAAGGRLIRTGKVAAFVVAGGQGTRLGFEGPKGNYPITPATNKTLFKLFAEIIAAVGRKYEMQLVWYIMASPLNYAETVEIFRANDYYGLGPGNVVIFQQGVLPNFAFDGRILLADRGRIATSPDGHGGSLKALYESGAVQDMNNRGIDYISYWQIDNPLVQVFDPLFLGLHIRAEAEMSSKAVIKAYPKERIGNFCLVDGRLTVVEYSDLPDELAYKRKPDSSPLFDLGSIAIHIINCSFVEKLNQKGFALPLHRAVKKIPYIGKDGQPVNPTKPNGVKLETFVFDALPLAEKSIILQTIRTEEFAPVKNAAGVDSAETARRMMTERAACWLEAAGANVPRGSGGRVDAVIEIAPSFALDKGQLRTKKDEIPPIKPGETIYLA